eukprot:Gregarina_sp_Poly_1__4843@NODE_257_length_10511_cov_261_924071_g224_i0_p2_GENE_NODE_257_length_10511_cov_261_924071_g224_i0NODE_257_length_10511_cov_261_924071_g224_i0_p2_ORF_typecomplete_len693_score75_31zfCCCH/PF00642_24/7_8e03zfCCCH/PF00642_24/1e04zfCCCH/PF00642_24/2_4e05zfCCCH/PF00642_24/1_2e06Torus/PF16131_5/1_6e05Torus/PF16131_5/0_016zfCCCH_3/PF15663_5/7_1e03zfCCCH_3/PF15663_5/5_9e07zfCCCH_4/PF18044_1/0_65zfCCCH_4/PF18044_1/0_026Taeniidae_ag/PF05596_11/0_22Taeniidae_ag/PF05596_11/1_8e03zf_
MSDACPLGDVLCRCASTPLEFHGRLSYSQSQLPEALELLSPTPCFGSILRLRRPAVSPKLFVRVCLSASLHDFPLPPNIVALENNAAPRFVWFTTRANCQKYLPALWHLCQCPTFGDATTGPPPCAKSRRVLEWFANTTFGDKDGDIERDGTRSAEPRRKHGGCRRRGCRLVFRHPQHSFLLDALIEFSVKGCVCMVPTGLLTQPFTHPLDQYPSPSFFSLVEAAGLTAPLLCNRCQRLIWLCWYSSIGCRLCSSERSAYASPPTNRVDISTDRVWKVQPIESGKAVVLVEQDPTINNLTVPSCSLEFFRMEESIIKILDSEDSEKLGTEGWDSFFQGDPKGLKLVKLAPTETNEFAKDLKFTLGVPASAHTVCVASFADSLHLDSLLPKAAILPGEAMAAAVASDSLLSKPMCQQQSLVGSSVSSHSSVAVSGSLGKNCDLAEIPSGARNAISSESLSTRNNAKGSPTRNIDTKQNLEEGVELPDNQKDKFVQRDKLTSAAEDQSKEDSNAAFAKTRMCAQFRLGQCKRGSHSCKFAHSLMELRATQDVYKTKLCAFWSVGRCKAGSACRHAHGEEELRSSQNTVPQFKWSSSSVPKEWNTSPSSKRRKEDPEMPPLALFPCALGGVYQQAEPAFFQNSPIGQFCAPGGQIAEGLSQKFGIRAGLVVWGTPLQTPTPSQQLVWLNVSPGAQ